jgi:hypothetical protein
MENEIAATAMAAMALQSAMLKALVVNGVLTPQQATDAIDDALLMVEQSQSQSPRIQEVHSIARKLIEQALTPPPKSMK